MRNRVIFMMALCLIMGCATHRTAPVTFLGIPENESSGQGPAGSINGQTCQFDDVSAVRETTYQEYLSAKQADRVFVEETHGNTVYYAIKEDRDVPFESGGAWFVEVVRFKAKRP